VHRDAEIGAARALSNLGRHDDALARNDALFREFADDVTVAAEGALLALMAGRREAAERRLAAARALAPDAPAVKDVEARMAER
jgi:predicted Zn-dependent protease